MPLAANRPSSSDSLPYWIRIRHLTGNLQTFTESCSIHPPKKVKKRNSAVIGSLEWSEIKRFSLTGHQRPNV